MTRSVPINPGQGDRVRWMINCTHIPLGYFLHYLRLPQHIKMCVQCYEPDIIYSTGTYSTDIGRSFFSLLTVLWSRSRPKPDFLA